jgi:DNA-binding CsgD family transcriptional regulator/tetratricopeptide (TPR) repeat protein
MPRKHQNQIGRATQIAGKDSLYWSRDMPGHESGRSRDRTVRVQDLNISDLCATTTDELQLAPPNLLSGMHSMELLERERCLADLAEWLQAAAERGGCIALVGGEAGIGKTSLVQEFCRQQSETRVLWGACDALFTPRPLAPLHDIARQTKGALLTAISSSANRDEIFTATLDELERQKALVVFEDMHWADEATLDLVKYLGRRIHDTHAMLAVTYRDDEVGPRHPLRYVIGDLPRASVRRMSLPPLSESAVAQLASRAERPSKGLHSLTGGNPLFVTELLATPGDTVPCTVRDAVLARAVRLSPAAREIAELVCVVPGKTESWLLEQIVHPDDAGIECCLSIGMVRSEDGALAYRHELARRALEDSLSPSRRQSLHSMVLAELAAQPGISAARLAHHADGAHNADEVRRFAPVAASQAATVGAHREAASQYELALRYALDLAPHERGPMLEHLSYECYLTSQHERALEARRGALEIWRELGARTKEGDSLRWLSRLNWYLGRREEAEQYGAAAIVTLESLPPGPELAMAYGNRAQLHMEATETDDAIHWAQRAITLVEPWANNEILSDALNSLGTARLVAGDVSGWADLERSLHLALAGGYQGQVARAYTNLTAMAVSQRKFLRASDYLRQGLAYCELRDLDPWRLYLLYYSARMKFEQGNWLEASSDAETVLRHPLTTPVTRIPTLRLIGHLRIRRGDPDARSALAEARALAGTIQELQRIGTLAEVCAEAAWLAGDGEGVLREVLPVYELVCQRRDPRMKGELAAWLWRVGALHQHPTDIAEPYALEISGDWRGAAGAWSDLDCPYERATVLALYGGEPEQREALSIFEQLGAAPAVQMLRKKMREQGVRGVPRGSRVSTRGNPLGLTRREAEILALLSDGLRNSAIAQRLFVSTKTVDHHVSAILTKLGEPSRGEAVAMARKHSDKGGV